MTNTAQHTPGPWTHHKSDVHFHIESADRRICEVRYASNGDTGWTSEANAKLIAAAPQLLAAAKRALEYLTDHGLDLDGHEEEIVAGIRAELDDAITKAKGE